MRRNFLQGLDNPFFREYHQPNNFKCFPVGLTGTMIEVRCSSVPRPCGAGTPGGGKGMSPKLEPVPAPLPAGPSEKIRRTVTYVERYHWPAILPEDGGDCCIAEPVCGRECSEKRSRPDFLPERRFGKNRNTCFS